MANTTCPLEMLDLNESGTVEGGDVETWAADPVDINRDGFADVDDAMLIVGAIE